ncbi:chemotaxis protein CheX [Nocardioides thalensis]|uniref:Chemotaxis protein CheX n=1 Tax=Nocardioides thalensis TaxID=1914755 RepID=A0A853BYL8_9ACTN|nr:chemotaxis protein CheX [Nocardioides thalensis]NYI99835.1 chemotaxis protein CheX [Nocardioides thalensis]
MNLDLRTVTGDFGLPVDTGDVVAPAADDVYELTAEVWSSLLGNAIPLLSRPVPPGTPFDPAGAWSASVSVSGGWHGMVTVELTEYAARTLTRAMLALPDETPDDELGDADVADAVGELVNMVGGNVKSLMPGPSTLSLPAVAAGRAAFPSEVHEVARVDVTWAGEPVRVGVHVPTGESNR